MSTNELTAKVRRLKRLQTKAEELKEEITAIQDELKAVLTAQNVEEMKAGTFKIRFIPVVSNRFDTAAFKKTHLDLYNQYIKPTTSRRFSVV
ncbi:MAG: hypothetical protein J1E96_04560 [Ruminococcus sp.]|nr:hypothetical protein [Ruminococcus sp.]